MATGSYAHVPPLWSKTPPAKPFFSRAAFTKRLILILLISLAIYLLTYLRPNSPTVTNPTFQPIQWKVPRSPSDPRIAKAPILYSAYSNAISSRVLASHEAHGYDVHVLRDPILNGYADQLLWLHEVVVKELRKASEIRAEWIVYVSLSSPRTLLHV